MALLYQQFIHRGVGHSTSVTFCFWSRGLETLLSQATSECHSKKKVGTVTLRGSRQHWPSQGQSFNLESLTRSCRGLSHLRQRPSSGHTTWWAEASILVGTEVTCRTSENCVHLKCAKTCAVTDFVQKRVTAAGQCLFRNKLAEHIPERS